MSPDVAMWIVLGVAALGTEITGLMGFHHFRPLTEIVRHRMRRDCTTTGIVAAFLLWLVFHFLVQTWIPGQGS